MGFSTAVNSGYSLAVVHGFPLQWLLLLRSTGSRLVGSVVVAHGLSCSTACGILPGPGIEPMSPALAGEFLISGPTGKLPSICFYFIL